MNLTFIGLDERTPLNDAGVLSLTCEIGILYSESPKRRNRYPSLDFIAEAVLGLAMCAIHVCGRTARENLRSGKLEQILPHVQRIQINGSVSPPELASLCGLFHRHTIITQDLSTNHDLRRVNCRNHAILVDNSGGRGLCPDHWERPFTPKAVGFAGGLGPDNVFAELDRGLASQKPEWIDMETKIRSADDWFDVDLCRKVRKQVEAYRIHCENVYFGVV